MTLNINPSAHLNGAFSNANSSPGYLQNGFHNLSRKTASTSIEPSLGLKVNLSALQNTQHTSELAKDSASQLLRGIKVNLTLHKLSSGNVSSLL
jgi:hypothetical protein